MSSNLKSAVAHPEAGRTNLYRIAIVGAATLKGKEIAEVLSDRNFPSADIKLLDDDESLGQLETAGEEISFIQSVRAEQFEHVDFTFFACDQDCTRTNWKTAQKAGSAIVDLSFALEDVPEAMLRAPWIERQLGQVLTPELQPRPVVIAHPAAEVLAIAFCTRKSSSASTAAAGCAITTGLGCSSGVSTWPNWRSIQGARSIASGTSSRANERSTIALPAFCAVFQLVRVQSWSQAKKVKSTCSNCSARTL